MPTSKRACEVEPSYNPNILCKPKVNEVQPNELIIACTKQGQSKGSPMLADTQKDCSPKPIIFMRFKGRDP